MRLQEINNYLSNFPGPDLNTPLAEGELISILIAMIPAVLRRKMVSINFEPLTKSINEVIEYLEQLEVLDATEKKQTQKKSEAENKTKEKSKSKGKSQKRVPKAKIRKESLNQKILMRTRSSVHFARETVVNTGPIMLVTAILLRTWEIKALIKSLSTKIKTKRSSMP